MINILNVKPHVVSRDLRGYIVQMYGDPKTGKTTAATKFPQHLILGFEKGWNALPGVMAAEINSWTEFLQALKQLESSEAKEAYATIIIDTVDIAYNLVEEFVCMRAGADSINDSKRLPFGQGYAQAEQEFDKRLRKIVQMGYGLVLISHAEEKSVKDAAGEETTRIGPTVNKRASKVINRMADIIGYIRGHTVKDVSTGNEHTQTTMYLRGTTRYMAGSRFKYIPDWIEFTYDNLVTAIHDAIDKEAAEHGGQYIKDETSNLYIEQAPKNTFQEVMNEFNRLAEEIMAKEVDPSEISKRVETILGKDRRVADCTEEQRGLVENINIELQSYLSTL
jgi:hypothetical protein